ncbi:hypothetical protein MMC34_006798 [Xylographa carneopallida]|nr:hypothetical protein [Xylographa carneopallida]
MSFASRRKVRAVGQDSEDVTKPAGSTSEGESLEDLASIPVVRRPSSRPKHRSALHLSFSPGGSSMTEDGTPASEVFTPKKSSLSRQAISQNALRKSRAASDHVPIRQSEDRPSYNAAHLNELKTSTPSTPKDLSSLSDVELSSTQTLDVASKFGIDYISRNPAIPTDAEILEKKLRRARLAKEEKYRTRHSSSESEDEEEIGDERLDSDDDDFRNNANTISLLPARSKHPETRLVRDDEDIMEDFDSFVEDGGITLGRKAEREQKARKKAEMADLIAEAERQSSSADSDDSEIERRAEYEAAQTRKGMDGMRPNKGSEWGGGGTERIARTPPRITPLPTLGGCLERMREMLSKAEYSRTQKIKELEDVEREKKEIAEREEEIQRLLKETGERYDSLIVAAGIQATNGTNIERGLENLGQTSSAQTIGS